MQKSGRDRPTAELVVRGRTKHVPHQHLSVNVALDVSSVVTMVAGQGRGVVMARVVAVYVWVYRNYLSC